MALVLCDGCENRRPRAGRKIKVAPYPREHARSRILINSFEGKHLSIVSLSWNRAASDS